MILSVLEKYHDGDIIFYCDAGCSLYKSPEWHKIFHSLELSDMFVQRIYKRNDCWSRKEVLDAFADNHRKWERCYQYLATSIAFTNSQFSRQFVKEWLNLMVTRPTLVMDVAENDRITQHRTFVENRHDQAIFSALVYKYLTKFQKIIHTQWEHIEDYDPIFKQAIRATRLRHGEKESFESLFIGSLKRLIKDYILKPFYFAPLQWWYSKMSC